MIKEQPFPDKEENNGVSPEIEFETLRVTPKGYPEISPDQAMNGVIGFVVIGRSQFYYSRARGEFIPVGTAAYCFGCKDFDASSSMIPSTNDSNVFSHEICCTKHDGSRSHLGVEFRVVTDTRELISESVFREGSNGDLPQLRGWDLVLKDRRGSKAEELEPLTKVDYEVLLEVYESEGLILNSPNFSGDRKKSGKVAMDFIRHQIEEYEGDSPYAYKAHIKFNNPEVLRRYLNQLVNMYSEGEESLQQEILNSVAHVLEETDLFDDADVIRDLVQARFPVAHLVSSLRNIKPEKQMTQGDMERLVSRIKMIVDVCEHESIQSPQNPEELIILLKFLEECFFSESPVSMITETVEAYEMVRLRVRLKLFICIPAIPIFFASFLYVYIPLDFNKSIGMGFLAVLLPIIPSAFNIILTAIIQDSLENLRDVNSSIEYFKNVINPLKSCLSQLNSIHLSQENPSVVAEFQQILGRIQAQVDS
jgi:hypothetical protein